MAVISSPLSSSLQGGLVRRIAGSTFGGGGAGLGPIGGGASTERSEQLLEGNQQQLSEIAEALSNIRLQSDKINEGLNSFYNRMAGDLSIETARQQFANQYNDRLAERKLRTDGEQKIEQKIQNALSAPVNAVSAKVSGAFGNVGNAIRTLLFGWISLQLVDAVKAFSEGNVKKLRDIAGNLIRTFGFIVGAGGVFNLIKFGIGKVVSISLNLASKVAGFVVSGLFLKPFELLVKAIKNAWAGVRGIRPQAGAPMGPGAGGGPPAGPKGGKFGLMSLIGKTITGLQLGMNVLNGENIDAVLAGMSIMPGTGKVAIAVRGAAAAIFTIDEVMEAFGGNLTGKKRQELEDAKKSKPTTTPAQTTPTAQPQTPMMGEKKDEKGKGEGVEANVAQGDIPSGVSVSPGTEGTQATTPPPAVTPQTTMTPSAGDLSLGSTATTPTVTSTETTPTPAKTSAEPTPAAVTPAQTQSANMKMESLGPEPKPQTTVIAQAPAMPQKQSSPPAVAGSTDVPKIKSSNPENFYALYSQFNYNVVI